MVGRMAAAVELVHCASLVQDDLPCFDDAADAPRPARLSRGLRRSDRDPRRRRAAHAGLRDAGQRAGAPRAGRLPLDGPAHRRRPARSNGVIGGQALELEPHPVELGHYHRQKTAALFRAAAAGGAICCGAEADVSRWARIGELIGCALQLRDDIDDVEAPPTATSASRSAATPRSAVPTPRCNGHRTRQQSAPTSSTRARAARPATPETEALHPRRRSHPPRQALTRPPEHPPRRSTAAVPAPNGCLGMRARVRRRTSVSAAAMAAYRRDLNSRRN